MRSFPGTVLFNRVRYTTTVITLGSLLTLGMSGDVAAQSVDYANPLNTARGLSPTTLLRQLNPIETVQTITTPVLDRQAIDREDIKRDSSGLPPRFAIPQATFVSPQAGGTWERIDNDTWVWRLRIQCPDAHNIYLGFTRYQMPEGGQLFVYSTDGQQVIRAFTQADNEQHGQLWTPVVLTDDLTVEVTISAAQRDKLELELTTIGHGYRGFGTDPLALSGSCNIDVICPEGDPWRNEIPSVAVISTGTGTFCTGFMVNNTARDRTPFFMTAFHCGIGLAEAPSLITYWNYETSVCGGTPDGVLSDFNTGSIFRSGRELTDFTLVELDDDPDPAFGVTFAGWDRTAADPPSAVGIHHPATDEKRISFDDDQTFTTSRSSTSIPGDGNFLWLVELDRGNMEPGSSGSPIFNPDHRVVGQLWGGSGDVCGEVTTIWYGRFSRSWTGGGTPGTRLSNWLDPISTGETTIDTLGLGLSITPSGSVVHIGVVGGPFTPTSVMYSLNNTTESSLNYNVSLTSFIGLLLNGGTLPVAGTLAGGASVNVTISVGSALNGLAAGIYTETVLFEDLTNTISSSALHTVEVGQTLISVTPTTELVSGGAVGGPFSDTIVYTITSERPTPVAIEVSASHSWISLNGGPGPVNFGLSGLGDSAPVTIGISSAANALVNGTYNGTVTVKLDGVISTTRNVTLEVGRFLYLSSDTPIAIPDFPGGPIVSSIVVPDDFCISDVDVSVNITHTWKGDLTVELVSPDGVSVMLHNRTGSFADNVIETYDDDGGTLPDGPGLLSDLELTQSGGTWLLRVQDNEGLDIGTLNSWQLSIAPDSPGLCPGPQTIIEFLLDIDPGWTTLGDWAFGVPAGISGDPTSGWTGANVYGNNLSGNYPNNVRRTVYLTTGAIDLTGVASTTVEFQRWLGVEPNVFDNVNFQVSADGTNWTTVWANGGFSIIQTSWTLVSYDISGVADGQPTVFLRWGMGPTDFFLNYFGWNIDDI
ncbi:MAG: proprotein convertase P-domain-containing protein, partial [Planctomycetes bacterium]|nr:proprotein convertase P-domain-containing protein [Planctomycetota bacterium]